MLLKNPFTETNTSTKQDGSMRFLNVSCVIHGSFLSKHIRKLGHLTHGVEMQAFKCQTMIVLVTSIEYCQGTNSPKSLSC